MFEWGMRISYGEKNEKKNFAKKSCKRMARKVKAKLVVVSGTAYVKPIGFWCRNDPSRQKKIMLKLHRKKVPSTNISIDIEALYYYCKIELPLLLDWYLKYLALLQI